MRSLINILKTNSAKRGLNLLKKIGVPESVSDQFIKKNIRRLIPGSRAVIFNRVLRIFLIIILSAALSFGLYFSAVKTIDYIKNKNNLLPEIALNRNAAITADDGKYELELTEKEIIKTFERAREHFVENRDNTAQIEINRILFSNASENVKDKAKTSPVLSEKT